MLERSVWGGSTLLNISENKPKIIVDVFPENQIIIVQGTEQLLERLGREDCSEMVGEYLYSTPGMTIFSTINNGLCNAKVQISSFAKYCGVEVVWRIKSKAT
jgi:ABC-type sulfate transport system substrate-binding protein